jgi:hypothetical protein
MDLGDHTIFVGQVVAGRADPERAPVLLHRGYRRLGERIPRGNNLLVAVTRTAPGAGSEGDAWRADAFYYADQREGHAVDFELIGPEGDVAANGSGTTDRWGWAEWSFRAGPTSKPRVRARAGGAQGEAAAGR